MSTYTVDSIVSAVRTILDSHGYSSAISGTDEGKYLDGIIKSALVPAARTVLMAAPADRLTEAAKLTSGTAVTKGSNKGLRFLLPDTFLRFLYGKLSDWKAVVGNLLSEEDTSYMLQSKVGVCANPERPCAFLVKDAGVRYAELYGSRAVSPSGEVSFVGNPVIYDAGLVYVGEADADYDPADTIVFSAGGVIYEGILDTAVSEGASLRFNAEYPHIFASTGGTYSQVSFECSVSSSSPTIYMRLAGNYVNYEGVTGNAYAGESTFIFKVGNILRSTTLRGNVPVGSKLKYIPYCEVLLVEINAEWFTHETVSASGVTPQETLTETNVNTARIAIPASLYQAVLYQTAGMTAAQTQEQKLAEDLISIANNLMQ